MQWILSVTKLLPELLESPRIGIIAVDVFQNAHQFRKALGIQAAVLFQPLSLARCLS